jgi:hypothetical protein
MAARALIYAKMKDADSKTIEPEFGYKKEFEV